MNKRRRFKAKRRRRVALWVGRWVSAADYSQRRKALLWLRAYDGMVWP